MGLDTTGSIATYIAEIFDNLTDGVSGNLIDTVDLSRIHVENFTGVNIDPDAIAEKYQSAIVNFSKADTIDLTNAQAGGDDIKLAELSVSSTTETMSAAQYRLMGENSIKYIGRKIRFGKTLV